MRVRPRRLRRTQALRDLVAEVRVSPEQLIQPHFVIEGSGQREGIKSMPGIERQSVDVLVQTVKDDLELGITSVLLFGVPQGAKDPEARLAYEGTPLVAPTPTTATAACSTTATSRTTPACPCWPRWRWPTPRPART